MGEDVEGNCREDTLRSPGSLGEAMGSVNGVQVKKSGTFTPPNLYTFCVIDPHIFRAYDIRGKAESQITEEACREIGLAFGHVLQNRYGGENRHPTVALGRDARTHSPKFEAAMREGLVTMGCAVKMIGETPSPVNYFTICNAALDAGVQITASHNPKEDNGIKLQIRNAESFSGEDLQDLQRWIQKQPVPSGSWVFTSVPHENFDAVTPYLKKVTSLIPLLQGLKVVVDFGNGIAGPVYGAALKKAGAEVISLFEKPDGTFPNHIADPSNHETLKTLQETVRKEKAACGIAFDGDGDRVGFVDEEGRIIAPDYLLLLLAEDHLRRNPGSPIVYTVSMSSILETEVKRLGGKPIMCPVGHSFVEHTMRRQGGQLGGEQSGHFFCGEEFYGHDDALVAALRILSIFSQKKEKGGSVTLSGAPPAASSTRHGVYPELVEGLSMTERGGDEVSFSSLFSHFPKVYQSPEWRPHCPDEKKGEIIRSITDYFQKTYPCITIDGIRIDFGEGAWAGIRQSNTSPKISVCMEARSREKLEEVESLVKNHLILYPDIGV